VNTRAVHEHEDTVRLIDDEAELNVAWTRPIEDVRKA